MANTTTFYFHHLFYYWLWAYKELKVIESQHSCQKYWIHKYRQNNVVVYLCEITTEAGLFSPLTDELRSMMSHWLYPSSNQEQTRKRCPAEHDTCKIHPLSKGCHGYIKLSISLRLKWTILIKAHVNQMKIDDFRSLTLSWPLTLWSQK